MSAPGLVRRAVPALLAQASPSDFPGIHPPEPGVNVPELVIGGIFALFALRSLARWWSTEFDAVSSREQVLYSLHATARVGMWVAFAGFFFGYALVDDPGRLRWYFLVPLGLAAIQFLTAMWLGLSLGGGRPGVGDSPAGNDVHMGTERGRNEPNGRTEHQPGPLESHKSGRTAQPGHPQPQAAEIESARLLANEAREALRGRGLTDDEIRTLADDYVAEDRGESLEAFIEWASGRGRRHL
jgi:hypothetical protein